MCFGPLVLPRHKCTAGAPSSWANQVKDTRSAPAACWFGDGADAGAWWSSPPPPAIRHDWSSPAFSGNPLTHNLRRDHRMTINSDPEQVPTVPRGRLGRCPYGNDALARPPVCHQKTINDAKSCYQPGHWPNSSFQKLLSDAIMTIHRIDRAIQALPFRQQAKRKSILIAIGRGMPGYWRWRLRGLPPPGRQARCRVPSCRRSFDGAGQLGGAAAAMNR